MKDRETIIREALNKWYYKNCRGIIEAATGIGKTYAGILAAEYFIKKYPNEVVLIVCPTETVIFNFKQEFKKFKKTNLLNNCKFICYASILKESNASLVILDEVHHIVTENKLKFFKNINAKGILGLSASIKDSQKIELNKLKMPIVYTFTLNEASQKQFIAKFTIINLPVELSTLERREYNRLTNIIDFVKGKNGTINWRNINKRKSIVNNAENKFKILKSIVDLFNEEYGIIFTLEKETVNKAVELIGDTSLPIHSGISKKNILKNLNLFFDGRSKVKQLVAATMLDEGMTLPRVTYSILLSRFSTTKQSIQTFGRAVRLDIKDKHSIIIRLYCKDTIEETWVKESQIDFIVKYVKNYEELRNEISKIRNKII